LFSGLETFIRTKTGDKNSKISKLASDFLSQNYAINVKNTGDEDLKRNFSSYTYIRNALFHNSEIKVIIRGVEYKLTDDYFSSFRILVSLVILKAVDFDDGYINWNSWIDRMR
jgi:hypothetical protein